MDITVYCPHCGSRYFLKPELRGQRMRCPNAICREVFEVQDAAESTPPAPETANVPADEGDTDRSIRRTAAPAEANYVSGSVGQMVPLLSTESADEPVAPAEPPPAEPAWQQAPPPVRAPGKKAEPPAPRPPAETPAAPVVESRAWQDAPPPVRQPAATISPAPTARRPKKDTMPAPEKQVAVEANGPKEIAPDSWEPLPVRRAGNDTVEAPPEKEAYPPPRRSAMRWIVGMLVLLAVVVVVGIKLGSSFFKETEEKAAAKARDAYENGNFPQAATIYQKLQKDFPESESRKDYEFWEDFSRARSQVKALDVEAGPALEQLRGFIQRQEKHALFAKNEGDVWEAYGQLMDVKLLPTPLPDVVPENVDALEQTLAMARAVLAESERFAPRGSDGGTVKSTEREKHLAELQAAVTQAKELRKFLAWLKEGKQDLGHLREAERRARDLGFDKHPRVRAWVEQTSAELLPSIGWIPGGRSPAPPARTEQGRTLLIVPRLDRGPTLTAPAGVVLALARGVLYALAEADGEVLWADRVGIDTTALPVRLPKDEGHPRELVLVLSSDTNLLTARDALTGTAHWQYHLEQPCLGRPVIVNRKAYLAAVDGWVHVIETVKGQLLGRFKLGLPLNGTGIRQEGTSLVYFPADAGFVYVIDVENHKCVGVLQTGHPSGSLRGEPILVSDDGKGQPRYLILSQTDGLDAMKLRAYRLPIEKITRLPPLQPEPRVRGWSWFPPHCDGEKVVLATDAGMLGLFGINQYHNQDAPLFPLVSGEQKLEGESRQPGRAQVVHATENDFWVLAQGLLQHYRLNLAADRGLALSRVWPQPLALGSPLHAAQVSDEPAILFVVTQAPDGGACLATAVEAATGKVRWQRQLGLSDPSETLRIGDTVIVPDPAAGLFVFDPKGKTPWQVRPLDTPGSTPAAFLPADGGESAYALLVPSPGKLALRRCDFGKKPADGPGKEFAGVLGGTPALGTGCLVLPLADGMLARLALTPGAKPDPGRHWRAAHADAGAVGHVAALGGAEFLVTDGSRGLLRLNWPGTVWEKKGEAQLEDRVVAAPLVLPGDGPVRVCVVDAAGNLLLLDGTKLKELRRWSLGGKITAGPFLLGSRVGCVVDRRRLVCVDPSQEKPLWERTLDTGTGIVGRPQEMSGAIVLADQSGRYVALDPETGTPRGDGYALQASVAPAAAPVAFGPDRVFAPLTDGTVLVLTLEQLTAAKK